jgi:hypothetical protein
VRTRGGRAVLTSSWIIVAFWIVAIVFTVAYVDVERASHPYDMTGVAHSSSLKHPKRLRTAHGALSSIRHACGYGKLQATRSNAFWTCSRLTYQSRNWPTPLS